MVQEFSKLITSRSAAALYIRRTILLQENKKNTKFAQHQVREVDFVFFFVNFIDKAFFE